MNLEPRIKIIAGYKIPTEAYYVAAEEDTHEILTDNIFFTDPVCGDGDCLLGIELFDGREEGAHALPFDSFKITPEQKLHIDSQMKIMEQMWNRAIPERDFEPLSPFQMFLVMTYV